MNETINRIKAAVAAAVGKNAVDQAGDKLGGDSNGQ